MNITELLNEQLITIEIPDSYGKSARWPLDDQWQTITTKFGEIYSPFGTPHRHRGLDIDIPNDGGEYPVYAASTLPVVFTHEGSYTGDPSNGGYGNQVRLGSGPYEQIYGHLKSIAIRGGVAEKGQIIGYAGNTGLTTGAHLHFETKWNGNPIDPNPILGGTGDTPEEPAWKKIVSDLTATLRDLYDKQKTSTEPGWPKTAKAFTTMLVERIDAAIVAMQQAGDTPDDVIQFWQKLSEQLKHSGSLAETNTLLEKAFDWVKDKIPDPRDVLPDWFGAVTDWLGTIGGTVAAAVIGIVLIGFGAYGLLGNAPGGKAAQSAINPTKKASLAKNFLTKDRTKTPNTDWAVARARELKK